MTKRYGLALAFVLILALPAAAQAAKLPGEQQRQVVAAILSGKKPKEAMAQLTQENQGRKHWLRSTDYRNREGSHSPISLSVQVPRRAAIRKPGVDDTVCAPSRS